jgi:hypothetical protein
VSRNGRRSRSTNEQNVSQFPEKRPHLRVVKEELDEGPAMTGGAIARARDECRDDRPRSVAGPGVRLRRQREGQGLTIDDLARTTKINKTILIALETNDVQRLPAAIYTKGFVKAYAREVGLDPETTADEYLAGITSIAEHAPLDSAGHLPPVARPASPPGPAISDDGVSVDNSMGQFGWVTTIVAVVGLIAYLGYLGSAGDDTQPEAPVVRTEQPVESDVAPALQSDRLAPDATKAAAGPLRVELRTNGLCWVALSVDGEPVLARLLRAGEHLVFEVEAEAEMRVGDPGALSVTINGRPGRSLGEPEEPVDVRITRTNFRQYLAGQ